MPENTEKSWRDRGFDFINNIYAGVTLVVIFAVASILYTRFGQAWEIPIINGLTREQLCSVYFYLFALFFLCPVRHLKPLPRTLALRSLHGFKFSLTVKTINDEPDADFSYIVTTEGGKKIGVTRHLKFFPDYIYVSGLLTLTDEEKAIVSELSDVEKFETLFNVQQELWRGVFGYDSRNIATTGLTLHLRIPITESIKEPDVLHAIWRMEAIIGSIMGIKARAALHHNESKKRRLGGEQIQGEPRGQQEIRRGDEQATPSPKPAAMEENQRRRGRDELGIPGSNCRACSCCGSGLCRLATEQELQSELDC